MSVPNKAPQDLITTALAGGSWLARSQLMKRIQAVNDGKKLGYLPYVTGMNQLLARGVVEYRLNPVGGNRQWRLVLEVQQRTG